MSDREEEKPSPPKADLRMHALTTDDLAGGPLRPGVVRFAMLDIGAANGMATVVSFDDGTTSLYTSTGGGVIGVGMHPQANAESRAFVALAEKSLGLLAVVDDLGLLPPNEVQVLARTGDGVFGARAPEASVAKPEHPLYPLWVQAQRVLTLIRLISEAQQRGQQPPRTS